MLFVKVVLASFRCQHFGALFSETVRVPEGALPDVILKQARIASRRFDKDDNVLWFETLQGWTTTFKATQQRSTTYFCPLYFDPNKHVLVRMLVNPSDPHFGHHEVFVKQHGLQVIRESMARLTADEFVFVDSVGMSLETNLIEKHDILLTCLPKRDTQACKIVTKNGLIHARCLAGPVGNMRAAIARLNHWALIHTFAFDEVGETVDDRVDTRSGPWILLHFAQYA